MARLPHYPPRQTQTRFAVRVRLQETSMEWQEKVRLRRLRLMVVSVCVGLGAASGANARMASDLADAAQQSAPAAAPNPATRPVGTIKTISGKTIVLTTDAGTEVTI